MRKVMLVAGLLMLGWPVAHMLLAQDPAVRRKATISRVRMRPPIFRNGSPT